MSPIGGHLAVLEGSIPLRRLYARLFGTRDLGMQIRGRHLLRATSGLGGERVLDLGCGNGVLTTEVARRQPRSRVVGMDLDEDLVAQARALAEASRLENVRFLAGDASRLPPNPQYDLVVLSDVLEHLDDPTSALCNAAAALRLGGHLVLHVPSGRNPVPLLSPWISRSAQVWAPLGETAPGAHGAPAAAPRFRPHGIAGPFEFPGHRREGFSAEELRDLLQAARLRTVAVRPTWGPLERICAELWLLLWQRRARLYNLLHPLLLAVSLLDLLLLRSTAFYERNSNGLLVVAVRDAPNP